MIQSTGKICVVGIGSLNAFGTARTSYQVRTGRFDQAVPELARLQGLIKGNNGSAYAEKQIVNGQALPASADAKIAALSPSDIKSIYRDYVDHNIGIRIIKPNNTESGLDAQAYERTIPTILKKPIEIAGKIYPAGSTLHLPRIDQLGTVHAATLPEGFNLKEEGGFKDPQYAEMQRVHLIMMRALSEALINMGVPWGAIEEAVPSHLRTVAAANGLSPGHAIEQGMTYGKLGLTMPDWIVAKYISNTMAFYLGKALGAETSSCRVDACNTGIANLEDLFARMVSQQMLFGALATAESVITVSSIEGFQTQMALADNKAVSSLKDHPSLISRPGFPNRLGFTLGEGGGVLLLADEALADALGLIKYARLLSATTTMGQRGTAKSPDPAVPTAGVKSALKNSIHQSAKRLRVTPQEVVSRLILTHGHGTSTDQGDKNAISSYQEVLKEYGRSPQDPLFVLYSKGGMRIEGVDSARKVGGNGEGHTLGGASSRSSVEVAQILNQGLIPPSHQGLSQLDSDFVNTPYLIFPTQPLAFTPDPDMPAPLASVDSQAFGDGNGNAIFEHVFEGENSNLQAAIAWREEQFARIEGGLAKPAEYVPSMSAKKAK